MITEEMKALRPTPISLKTAMLSKGMTVNRLCSGENSTVRVHCYSVGMGEKHGLHAHVEEEHLFVVLHGSAVFSDLSGRLPPLHKNAGLWIPRGCFYEFFNPGPEPLIVLRFGAMQKGADETARVDPDGVPIPGRSRQNPELARPEVIEGAFFE